MLLQHISHRLIDACHKPERAQSKPSTNDGLSTPQPRAARSRRGCNHSRLVTVGDMDQARKKSRPFSAVTSNPRTCPEACGFRSPPDGSNPPAVVHAPADPAATSSRRPPSGTPRKCRATAGCAPSPATGRRAGRQRHAVVSGKEDPRIPGAHGSVVPSTLPAHARPQNGGRIDSFRMAGKGLRRTPYPAPERQRSRTNQAAASGIHGQPGNSCSGSLGCQKPLRNRYVTVDSAGGFQQPCDGARVGTGSEVFGGSSATSAVTHVLWSTPACGGQLRRPPWRESTQAAPAGSISPAPATPGRVDRGFGPRRSAT